MITEIVETHFEVQIEDYCGTNHLTGSDEMLITQKEFDEVEEAIKAIEEMDDHPRVYKVIKHVTHKTVATVINKVQ